MKPIKSNNLIVSTMTQDDISNDIADFLQSGGTITSVDSTANKDANVRFRYTNDGPRYLDPADAKARQHLHNREKK